MPCFSCKEDEPGYVPPTEKEKIEEIHKDKVKDLNLSILDLKSRLAGAMNERSKYRASFCAIVTQLKRKGILESVVLAAESNGFCDITPLIKEHNNYDTTRVLERLKEFSIDEIHLIKDVLNNQEI